MPREPEPTTSESTFLHAALKNGGQRTDGRTPYDMRDLHLRFSNSEGVEGRGWCECTLGETRVVVQVSAEIVKPLPDRPYEGFLLLGVEISPMASPAYEVGRSSEEETLLVRLLEKALRKSNAIDREALCIIAGQQVWSIRVDIHCLNDEGNFLDCACIGAMTALRHFRRPDVTVVGEQVTVHSMKERVPIPLAIHHTPICLTFAFFGPTSIPLLDPSHLESLLATSTLHLTLNSQGEVCVLSKMGGIPLEVDVLMGCLVRGGEEVKRIDEKVRKALEREEKRRGGEIR